MKILSGMAAVLLLIFASAAFADTGDVLKAAHEKVESGDTSAAVLILQEGIQKAPGDADLRFMIAGISSSNASSPTPSCNTKKSPNFRKTTSTPTTTLATRTSSSAS